MAASVRRPAFRRRCIAEEGTGGSVFFALAGGVGSLLGVWDKRVVRVGEESLTLRERGVDMIIDGREENIQA